MGDILDIGLDIVEGVAEVATERSNKGDNSGCGCLVIVIVILIVICCIAYFNPALTKFL